MTKNKITAVLGPTNTGKTHLAIETMLSFDNGMIGFPLRLLAREVYDKILKKVDPSKVEPEDDFEDREDKDIDNDGDVDDSDEYLHKKRQAITKAIKKESSIGGVVGIPALGDFVKGK